MYAKKIPKKLPSHQTKSNQIDLRNPHPLRLRLTRPDKDMYILYISNFNLTNIFL